MNHIILGGAGFIGSNLAAVLVHSDTKVVVLDDLSNGKLEYLRNLPPDSLKFFEVDLSGVMPVELLVFISRYIGSEPISIWHFAANSDIQKGIANPRIDFMHTLATTITALNLAEYFNPQTLVFASSSAIYGDANGIPFTESQNSFDPISTYGVMKLASEQTIKCFRDRISNTKIRIYRFPNVIGLPLTHGVIHDFYSKLITSPPTLQVLGDGNQCKPFLHVDDLIFAMSLLNENKSFFEVFNIGPADNGITIRKLAEKMRDEISPRSILQYGNTPYGWKGDVPKYSFDTSKSFEFGLTTGFSSERSVDRVLNSLKKIK